MAAAAAAAGIPILLGLMSAGGQMLTNREQRRIAREQMDFQERMSSTSAQRAVEDYRKAGLNPALAYDRGASSPSGASATIGDPINAGLSTARAAAALQQELRQSREMHYENVRLTKAQTTKAATEAATTALQGDLLGTEKLIRIQNLRFNELLNPATLRNLAVDALLKELQVPGARNTAAFEQLIGRGRPGLATAKTAAEILKLLTGKTRY